MNSENLPTGTILNADKVLNTSAKFWFLVTVIGQWIFVYYVVTFYVGTAAQGDFEKWNEVLPHGYVAGETMGNLAVAIHLFLAIVVIAGGPLQLVPQIQTRARTFHRWNGRLYITTAFVVSISGLYMVWTRGTVGGFIAHVSISINAILIFLCAVLTWRFAVIQQFKTHRHWALRLFLVVNGVWFFRIGLMFWVLVNGRPVGFDPKTFTGPFLTFLGFAQYLLPLAVLELYLRAQNQSSTTQKIVVATVLFVFTMMMGVGIFGATMGMWLPRL